MSFRLTDVGGLSPDGRRALEQVRQNSAWGIAQGWYVPTTTVYSVTSVGAPWVAISPTITTILPVGRRHKVTYVARAWSGSGGTACVMRVGLLEVPNLASGAGLVGDHYFESQRPYNNVAWSTVLDGTGGSRTFVAAAVVSSMGTNTSLQVFATEFYIEDIGPVR